jgi:DNA repair exonuclease SbcCD ATPase subunit
MADTQVVQERTADLIVTSETLADFQANRLGLAPDDAPEAVEEPTEPVEAEADENELLEAEDEATEIDEEPKKANPKLEKRFSKVTRRAEAAEAKARELEDRLKALENPRQEIANDGLGEKPQASQFADAYEYAEALAEWSAEKALQERDRKEAEKQVQLEQQKIAESWKKKVETVKAELPDWDEVVASSTVSVSDELRDAILDSDYGAQLLYELASDDDYAAKLASMPTIKALRELGKLEAKFEKTEEPKSISVKQTKAPKPLTPIKATGSAINEARVDNDGRYHGTYAQWKADRLAGRIR